MGRSSKHALYRAIRVAVGSSAAVRAALQLRCDVCESQHHPGPLLRARLRTEGELGDTAAVDLFVRADNAGNQLGFVDMLDFCEHFLVTVPSKHPKVVGDQFLEHWITPFGVPRRLIYDHGGEFERECGQELENLGCELMPTAAITPQRNAVCERHGGVWKSHARLIDEFSIKYVPEQMRRVTWLTTAVSSTYNSAFDDSGRVLPSAVGSRPRTTVAVHVAGPDWKTLSVRGSHARQSVLRAHLDDVCTEIGHIAET